MILGQIIKVKMFYFKKREQRLIGSCSFLGVFLHGIWWNICWTLMWDLLAVAAWLFTCSSLLQSMILSRYVHDIVCKCSRLTWMSKIFFLLSTPLYGIHCVWYIVFDYTHTWTQMGSNQVLSTLDVRFIYLKKHKHCAFSGKRHDSLSALLKI